MPQQFNASQSAEYMTLLMLEKRDALVEEEKEEIRGHFFSAVLLKRIEVMELPIQFTDYALLGVSIFCDRVGAAVVLLIDALEKFGPKEKSPIGEEFVEVTVIDAGKLADLYPHGFYTEAELLNRIDEIQAHKTEGWNRLY